MRLFVTAWVGLWTCGFTSAALAVDFLVPISSPLLVNRNAIGDMGRDIGVHFAADGAGHWIAVWQSDENLGGTIGADFDILFSRSADFGMSWSPPATLNTTAASDGASTDRNPFIMTDRIGHWLCAWESDNSFAGALGSDHDIVCARSLDDGATWSAPTPLNVNAGADERNDLDIHVAPGADDVWIAVWRTLDTLVGTLGEDADLLVARSTDFGLTWSYPAPLNTNATSDSGHDIKPDLASDDSGNWIVVWQSTESFGGAIGTDNDILYCRSGNNGASWTAPQALNSNAVGNTREDIDPRIATDTAGHWMVIWVSDDSLNSTVGLDRDILVSRSDDQGVTWTTAAALHSNAAADSGADQSPQIACDHAGKWAVVWSSAENLGGAIGTDFDLFIACSEDHGSTWSDPAIFNVNATTDAGPDEFPVIITDRQGAWVAIWEVRGVLGSPLGLDGDIYSARFALPDCNNNIIPDSVEPDANNNGIPDECEPSTCPPDIAPPPNGNNVVNVDDLLALLASWGPCPPPFRAICPADIVPRGGDGTVNVDDLLAIISAWGPCP